MKVKDLGDGKRLIDNHIVVGPGLTDEEALRLVDMKKEQFKDAPPVGKYKVEVLFGKGMRMDGTPCPGLMTFWESRTHGADLLQALSQEVGGGTSHLDE